MTKTIRQGSSSFAARGLEDAIEKMKLFNAAEKARAKKIIHWLPESFIAFCGIKNCSEGSSNIIKITCKRCLKKQKAKEEVR